MEITIPTDNDGYILLQCQYFKVMPTDMEDESVFPLYCPMCGLTSNSYLTSDVIDLANKMITNYAMDELYESFKQLERSTKRSPVRFKAGKKPKHEYETPIYASIDDLEIVKYPCCSKTAKVSPIIKMAGCYYPFCGVRNDGS